MYSLNIPGIIENPLTITSWRHDENHSLNARFVFETQNPFKNNSIDIFSNETNKTILKNEEHEISFPDFFRNNELTKSEQVFGDNYGFSDYSKLVS